MTIKIENMRQWEEYIIGVMGRAAHHAPEVRFVIPSLIGGVLIYKDDVPVEVRPSRDGQSMANQVWVRFRGQWISFSYRHREKQIVALKGGTVLRRFDNRTTLAELHLFFMSLVLPSMQVAA